MPVIAATASGAVEAVALEGEFLSPPASVKPWCYWWWLNGAASKEGITRDFEEMRHKGISGALLFDAGQAGPEAPRGPEFMSAAWRELYKHALREADRCGIALGVNLCSGWNAGGPWVTEEHAAKRLVASQTVVKGPGNVRITLPVPRSTKGFYRDIAILACPVAAAASPPFTLTASSRYQDLGPDLAADGDDETRWVSNGHKPGMGPTPERPEYLQFSFADAWEAAGMRLKPFSHCGPKDIEVQCSDDGQVFRTIKRLTLEPQVETAVAFGSVRAKYFRVLFLSSQPFRNQENWNVQVAEVDMMSEDEFARGHSRRRQWDRGRAVELTKFADGTGLLKWEVPQGQWQILRLGFTLHGRNIKCVGSGPGGPEIDTMSAEAMDAHFAETGAKLLADAGTLAGKTLQYFHIDSWELGQPTWTPRMREEFLRRRGHDPLTSLPAVLGWALDSPDATLQFMQDYRRTAADLVAANYYGRLRELTLQGGLRGTHPESGGPMFDHWIDPLQCAGINDVPMGEFWKRNSEPDGPITHHHNPSLKQAASAAHVYGKPICQAEAFTSFGCDWIDDPWSMKDIGDAAFCEGLTRHVLCFWVHQPRPDAKPGFQWAHVGTHFDCNLTWWPMADAWLTYLARCQHLLRQGLFVADFAYLQSEAIPGFIAQRPDQQPARPPGFDYDAINAEALLSRAAAKDGRLTLPDGMSYRYLVLPHANEAILSHETLRKVNQLVAAGVTVVGPKTFGGAVAKMREGALDTITRADGLPPDIEFGDPSAGANFDWIHRRDGGTDIYFVSNQAALDASAEIAFRVTGKQPELWDAVTGSIRDLPDWRDEGGRTITPLQFAPRQSRFLVFRRATTGNAATASGNRERLLVMQELAGPWSVAFDPKWGTPGRIVFENLEDWTTRPEDGIRHYSGIATYRLSFEPARPARHAPRLYLDLGKVKNVARVRINGRDRGVVWTAPWRVEITGALKPGANDLEIEVANLWPNRLIGDATLPEDKRFTTTNVRTYDTMASGTHRCLKCEERKRTGKPPDLLPSGLLGPVRLMAAER